MCTIYITVLLLKTHIFLLKSSWRWVENINSRWRIECSVRLFSLQGIVVFWDEEKIGTCVQFISLYRLFKINIYELKSSLQREKNITSKCRIRCSIELYISYRENRFLEARRKKKRRHMRKMHMIIVVTKVNIYELKR